MLRVLSSGILCCVVWEKFTDVSPLKIDALCSSKHILHGIISQETVLLTATVVRTPNLADVHWSWLLKTRSLSASLLCRITLCSHLIIWRKLLLGILQHWNLFVPALKWRLKLNLTLVGSFCSLSTYSIFCDNLQNFISEAVSHDLCYAVQFRLYYYTVWRTKAL
jgi:hypothetical protein